MYLVAQYILQITPSTTTIPPLGMMFYRVNQLLPLASTFSIVERVLLRDVNHFL
jgi:hypothetical protein